MEILTGSKIFFRKKQEKGFFIVTFSVDEKASRFFAGVGNMEILTGSKIFLRKRQEKGFFMGNFSVFS